MITRRVYLDTRVRSAMVPGNSNAGPRYGTGVTASRSQTTTASTYQEVRAAVGRNHRVLRTVCPACSYRADAAARVGGDRYVRPDDGDVSLCINCGAVSLFDAAAPGGLVAPDRQTLDELMTDPRIALSVGYIRQRGLIR